MIHIEKYAIARLVPYINWVYFFHAWGMPPRFSTVAQVHDCPGCRGAWLAQFPQDCKAQAQEAQKLFDDAREMLHELMERQFAVHAIAGLYPAWSEGDDVKIIAENDDVVQSTDKSNESEKGSRTHRLCFLRQQQVKKNGDQFLCLADFISPHQPPRGESDPHSLPIGNVMGLFATAVEKPMEQLFATDDFKHLLAQTLSDRLAEAASEVLHEEVRKTLWGYAPQEHFSPQELFSEKYQGRRPAIGYPSLPDQSFMFDFAKVLPINHIGISLTENGMMCPHAAVAGLMLGHPAVRHFAVGAIDETQLEDYARRRGRQTDEIKRYLVGNLCN